MNFLSRLLFWFEDHQGYLKLGRYRTKNTKFYSALMYHGVENDQHKRNFRPYDLSEQAVLKEIKFYLRQGYQLCSYVDVGDENLMPHSSLMLTFDDGHRNIAKTVRYLSRHYQIRPIIAICPGVIDAQSTFWFEEIYARLVLSKHKNIHPACSNNSDAHTSYRQIMDFYLADCTLKSKDLLSTIRTATDDVSDQQVRSHDAVHTNFNWDELCSLVDQNSCAIAVHTMYHDSVSHMSKDEFEADINECKRLIQKNLNVDVKHFVYPFGYNKNDWETQVLSNCALDFSYVVEDKINTDTDTNYLVTRISGRDFSSQTGYYRFLWHQRHSQLITLR